MIYPTTPVPAAPRLTGLIAAVFVLAAGCTAAGPATQPVQKGPAWGLEVNGLRARFTAPAEIEQNAPLAASFELRCDPASVPAGMTGFDTYFAGTHLRLTLTSEATGRAVEIESYRYGGPLIVGDPASPLDGTPLSPVQTEFPLRAAGEEIKPGAYDCVVSYSSERGYTEYRRSKGLWRGELRTVPVRLTIKPEVLRDVTFQVPNRLRLTPDQKIIFLPEDAQRVTVALGNGIFLHTRVARGTGFDLTGGTLKPGVSNPIDDWSPADSHPRNDKVNYTIEVFATAEPPGPMQPLGPGADYYRTLWKEQFVVQVPK